MLGSFTLVTRWLGMVGSVFEVTGERGFFVYVTKPQRTETSLPGGRSAVGKVPDKKRGNQRRHYRGSPVSLENFRPEIVHFPTEPMVIKACCDPIHAQPRKDAAPASSVKRRRQRMRCLVAPELLAECA